MARQLSPVLIYERVVEPGVWLLRRIWIDWLNAAKSAIDNAAQKVGGVDLTAQGAAISATAIPILTVTTGLYRITHYLRITRAATTSSEATLTIAWTDGGVAMSNAFALVNGNTTATFQTGTLLIRADVSTEISYAITYASVGGTSMQFALYVRAEAVP